MTITTGIGVGLGRAALTCALLASGSACGDAWKAPTTPPGPRRARLTIVSGDGQTGEVGARLANPLVVRVTDSLGVPAAGVVVEFTRAPALPGDSIVTDAAGIASTYWILDTLAMTQQITARATVFSPSPFGRAQATFSATGRAGPAKTLTSSAGDRSVGAPGSLLDTISIVLADRYGNLSASALVAWRVKAGDGSVKALASQTDGKGAARALWTLGPSVGENVLEVVAGTVSRDLVAIGAAGFVGSAVVVGGSHSCALAGAGTAFCWGDNAVGQLGIAGSDGGLHKVPRRVAGGLTFVSLAAGAQHTCGLTSGGDVYCWGSNDAGQLGHVDRFAKIEPTRVARIPAMTALVAGTYHTCGLTTDGVVYCWGDNAVGQMGDGSVRQGVSELGRTPRANPEPVATTLRFIGIAASYYATCGVSTAGDAYCWGGNDQRDLGTPVSGKCRVPTGYWDYGYYEWPCSPTPVAVGVDRRLTSVTGSSYAFCGVTTTTELVCWGNSLPGSLTVPGARVSRAWVVGTNACGLEPTGRISCWKLETGFTTVRLFGDLTFVNLSSNGANFCGVADGAPGALYCRGFNFHGQLGDGTRYNRDVPVQVLSPPMR